MVSLYLGEDAFLGSHEIGNDAQFRFSSCKGFLLPPHPQVRSPVSRKRFARSHASSLLLKRDILQGCLRRMGWRTGGSEHRTDMREDGMQVKGLTWLGLRTTQFE